jgi:outer membrane protein with beta-barrel domain
VATLIVSILLAAMAVVPTSAADSPGIDVRAGLTASRFGGELHDAFPDGRTSATGSLGLSFALTRTLSLGPEVAWISKGGVTNVRFTVQSGTTIETIRFHESWTADYIEVPVMLRWESPPGARVRPYLVLGPGFAWRTGGRVEEGGFEPDPAGRPSVRFAKIFEGLSGDVPSRFRRFDLDAIAGIGIAAGRGRVRAMIEARHLHGLLDAMPGDATVSAYQHAFTFTAGLALR